MKGSTSTATSHPPSLSFPLYLTPPKPAPVITAVLWFDSNDDEKTPTMSTVTKALEAEGEKIVVLGRMIARAEGATGTQHQGTLAL